LGGYGPGYSEVTAVDAVRHGKVCTGVIR